MANGRTSTPPTLEQYRNYFTGLKQTDQDKNYLIQELLSRIETLEADYKQEKLDHDREKVFNRNVQLEKAKMNSETEQLRKSTSRGTYVLVLIDGDGMQFNDTLLAQGEIGGKEAGNRLWSAIRSYVNDQPNLKELSYTDYKIVVRIYAYQRGLANACVKAGITDGPFVIDEFARGFTGSKQLFDFIDVGSGKDRADEKISELFRMNLDNVHCQHIFFGCSHDNGYARLFEEVSGHPNLDQVTLLEGAPFERELQKVAKTMAHHKFEGLFRTSKIPNEAQQSVYQTPNQYPSHHASYMSNSMSRHSSSNGIMGSPEQHYSEPGPTIIPSTSPVPLNWTKAIQAAPAMNQLASPPDTPQQSVVPRNKFGQRIDKLVVNDTPEKSRIAKVKMCNVHFLRKDCPYGLECTHTHTYKPTNNELEILRAIGRSTPCKYGTECDDVKCIYGHRCPYSIPGKRVCPRFQDGCRFGEDMHGLDTTVVRTTKIS